MRTWTRLERARCQVADLPSVMSPVRAGSLTRAYCYGARPSRPDRLPRRTARRSPRHVLSLAYMRDREGYRPDARLIPGVHTIQTAHPM